MFVLEDTDSGKIRGTCQVFGQVGVAQPFYSYRFSTMTQTSPELGKTFRNEMLSLTTDLEGSSEVGGLFLHPEPAPAAGACCWRAAAICSSSCTAQRFGDAHLGRAARRDRRNRPGRRSGTRSPASFFGMTFPEADEFNAVHGTQFIADLMPRTPIYCRCCPKARKR